MSLVDCFPGVSPAANFRSNGQLWQNAVNKFPAAARVSSIFKPRRSSGSGRRWIEHELRKPITTRFAQRTLIADGRSHFAFGLHKDEIPSRKNLGSIAASARPHGPAVVQAECGGSGMKMPARREFFAKLGAIGGFVRTCSARRKRKLQRSAASSKTDFSAKSRLFTRPW